MKPVSLIALPLIGCVLFWSAFTACVIEPPPDPPPPAARIVLAWDPVGCVDARRIVVELEDEDGIDIASSSPCWLGAVTLDAPSWGIYRGRLYTWMLDQPISDVRRIEITVDAPIVRWQLSPPP